MEDLTALGERLRADGLASRQRRLVVVEGPQDWTRATTARLLGTTDALWLGDAPEGAPSERPDRARRLLGRTVDALVFDLHGGVDPDSMAAGLLAVVPGGLAILRCPPRGGWTRDGLESRLVVGHPDSVAGRFLARFKAAMGRAQATVVSEEGVVDRSPASEPSPFSDAAQLAAVDAIVDHAAHGGPPVLLVGDRGRGKSTALGLAAAQIEGPLWLTGPGPSTLAAVATRFPDAVYTTAEDLLVRPREGFVIIDEAAALGMPTLQRLLEQHPRAALAATVHGYEGTGTGFLTALRRCATLRELSLEDGPRHAAGDPVEAFAYDALLLDADPSLPAAEATPESAEVRRLDRDELSDPVLRAIWGLLIMSHYRTRPSDMRRLLDGPNLHLWASFHEGAVVAAALVADEGGLDADHAAEIHQGLARPRGHVIPETLIAHCGEESTAHLRGQRIVRIATHPALVGRGLGRQLLRAIVDASDSDWFGAMFGATVDRIRFFGHAGLHPVWTSPLRGRSSGMRSCLSLRAKPTGAGMVGRLRRRFSEELVTALSDACCDEDVDLITALLRHGPALNVPLNDRQRADAVAAAWGPRRPEGIRSALLPLVAEALRDGRIEELSDRQRHLVIRRVLQAHPWSELLPTSPFGSEHPTRRALKQALRILLSSEPGALQLAQRFPEAPPMSKRRPPPVNPNRMDKIRQVVADRWSDLELVLEEVWDAHNVAAVMRSADAFGVGRVNLLYREEVFPELPIQTSGGVKRWMDLREARSPSELVADLKRRGRRIVVTALREDAVPLWDLDLNQPTALVFGNEHAGVSEELLEAADDCVIVPMAGMAQSLNISVSAGIVLSEVGRQRQGRDNPWDEDKQAVLDRWIAREVDR